MFIPPLEISLYLELDLRDYDHFYAQAIGDAPGKYLERCSYPEC